MSSFIPHGVMQGRLLPKYQGRYQAFPIGQWRNEFHLCKTHNINFIEFIFDFDQYQKNPLYTDSGLEQIINITQDTGVSVKTICADYFMSAPIHSLNENISANSIAVLKKILKNANKIGAQDIVLPCVDDSSLKNSELIKKFIKNIIYIQDELEKFEINLCLETDLSPNDFHDLLSNFESKKITVNYDTGNSASLDFDIIEEFQAYGDRITDIHIKDRKRGGGPVLLGTGDVNFDLFFKEISRINYKGPIIFQSYRDDEGLNIFLKQREWFKTKMEKLYEH